MLAEEGREERRSRCWHTDGDARGRRQKEETHRKKKGVEKTEAEEDRWKKELEKGRVRACEERTTEECIEKGRVGERQCWREVKGTSGGETEGGSVSCEAGSQYL